MNKVIYISIIVFLLGWFTIHTLEAQKFEKNRLTIAEFKEVLTSSDKIQIIDVRTEKEYNSGHIKGAILMNVLNRSLFMEQIETLDKEIPTYIYCRSGKRSLKALKIFKQNNFTDVWDLKNGYLAWKNSKN